MALVYTLNSVQQQNSSVSPSLVYYNNPFEKCTINNIMVAFESFARTAAQIARMPYAPDITAAITCIQPMPDAGYVTVNITAKYNYIPPTTNIYDGYTVFLGRNATSQASLYWGESLLAWYWSLVATDMTDYSTDSAGNWHFWGNDGTYTKGAHYFTLNSDEPTNIASYDFLNITYRAVMVYKDGSYEIIDDGDCTTAQLLDTDFAKDNPTAALRSADSLAKSFYSVIMTDLGQVDHKPNILNDPVLLHNFTAERNDSRANGPAQAAGIPLQTFNSSEEINQLIGPLGVRSSTIASSYLCQVPRQKPAGELIIAVLVADLVLLQALWQITMILAGWFVVRTDEEANWCEGCQESETELSRSRSRRVKGSSCDDETESSDGADWSDGTEMDEMQIPLSRHRDKKRGASQV